MKVYLVEAVNLDDRITIGICSSMLSAEGLVNLFCKNHKLTIVNKSQYEDGGFHLKAIGKNEYPYTSITIKGYIVNNF